MSGPQSTAPGSDAEPTLESLFAILLERIQADGPAAVEVFCAAHPARAAELRRRLGELRAFGLLDMVPAGDAVPVPGPLPERIGHHRLLRRLGAGGMGVVYLARDELLGREVALKTLHVRFQGSASARARFQREARALGQLRHPGIVPVFTVGEVDGGPYFTMEYLPGCTLAEVLRGLREPGIAPAQLTVAHLDRAVRAGQAPAGPAAAAADGPESVWGPSYLAAACRIVLRVAETLAHAHASGVLHRDIKPSNLLLAATGDVRLFDFGLAQWAAEEPMTLSGDLLGTPSYMAPEQIEGRHDQVDARTDVYALGATLHELLTLLPPFAGKTSHAVLRAIGTQGTESPRRLNPAMPRDLETLCLTAMAPERSRRYAGARELAEELRRFLDGRPILARPIGIAGRTWRFARRRPAAAAVIGLLALILLGTPAGLLIANVHIQAQAARAQKYAELVTDTVVALDAEELGKDARAADVLKVIASQVDNRLTDFPREQARLWVRIGSVLGELEPGAAAEARLARGAETLARLLGEAHLEVAQARNHLANQLQARGQLVPAELLYRQVLAAARQGSDRAFLATVLGNLAGLLVHIGESPEAEQLLHEGLALELAAEDGARLLLQTVLIRTLLARSALDAAQTQAAAVLADLDARPQGTPRQRVEILHVVGDVARLRGDCEAARAHYARALDLTLGHLQQDSLHEVVLLEKLGHVSLRTGDLPGAEARYRAALQVAGATFRNTPDHVELANIRHCLGRALAEQGRLDEALSLLREARRGLAGQPGAYAAETAAANHLVLGEALLRAGGPVAEAREELTTARDGIAAPPGGSARGTLRATRGLARAAWLSGDAQGARALYATALAAAPVSSPDLERVLVLCESAELLSAVAPVAPAGARLCEALASLQAVPQPDAARLAVVRYLLARHFSGEDPAQAAELLALALQFPGLRTELRRATVTVTEAELAGLDEAAPGTAAATGAAADRILCRWRAAPPSTRPAR